MAVLDKNTLGNLDAIHGSTFHIIFVFIPPRNLTNSPPTYAAGTKEFGGRVMLNIVTLLSTPIHITVLWITGIFKTLNV